MVDYLINRPIVLHVNQIGGLLDRSAVEAPLILVKTGSRQYFPFLLNMILNYNLVSAVFTINFNCEHITTVPTPKLVKNYSSSNSETLLSPE
jgi:hypothetical protein